MSDTDLVLDIANITKSFGPNKAVDSVSISVKRGEIFGFLGPNGAGKSTTIRLVLNLLRANSGTITILGRSSRHVATHHNIGFLSGDMVLDSDLTGGQYIQFVSNLHGGGHTAEIARLSEVLEANLDVKIGNYSRGNRQKVGLIAALAHKPQLLILDEPTSGFDPLVQEKFAELMREYVADGGTVFMSSHILAEVQHLCDRVAFIRGGKIVTTQTVAELLDTKSKRVHVSAEPAVVADIRKHFDTVAGLAFIEANSTSITFAYTGDTGPLLKFLVSKKLRDVTIREPELEEIFSQYYETTASAPEETQKETQDA